VSTTKNPTMEDLEAKVSGTTAEIEQIEECLAQARARVAQAGRELDRKEGRLRDLSPAVFSGNEEAQTEFEKLEAESEVLVRSRRVASDAVEGFTKELEEAKKRLTEARHQVHHQRYRDLLEERQELDTHRDELAKELCEVLEQQSALGWKMSQEVRNYDQEQANDLSLGVVAGHREWITETFRAWLR
jgi:predicted  nucleic acid-binding Zn-ribbon protein